VFLRDCKTNTKTSISSLAETRCSIIIIIRHQCTYARRAFRSPDTRRGVFLCQCHSFTTENKDYDLMHALIMKIWPVHIANKLHKRSAPQWRSNITINLVLSSFCVFTQVGFGLVIVWRMSCGSRPASASHSPPAETPSRGARTQHINSNSFKNEWRLLFNCQTEITDDNECLSRRLVNTK